MATYAEYYGITLPAESDVLLGVNYGWSGTEFTGTLDASSTSWSQTESMEQALCQYLTSKSAITALIGSGDGARLFPNVLPQDYNFKTDGVAVTYEVISSTDQMLIDNRAGLVQSRVQFSCYSDQQSEAMRIARAIKNSGVATLKGVVANVDFRGVDIVDGIRCYSEQPTDGSSEWLYIAEFDLMVSYHEG